MDGQLVALLDDSVLRLRRNRGARAVAQKFAFGTGRQEQVALVTVAAQALEKLELCLRFDAFGDGLEPQVPSHRDDCLTDDLVIAVAAYVGDKRSIDLELIDR